MTEKRRATRIVIANHKGGVSKTTTAVVLAEVLADAGKKVLVVDTDSQGNASRALAPAGTVPTDLPQLEACLRNPSATGECIVESWYDNVFLIASSILFEAPYPAAPLIASAPDAAAVLELIPYSYKVDLGAVDAIIRTVETEIDYVIIDTAPSLSLTTQSALAAADMVVLPCTPSKDAMLGLPDIVKLVAKLGGAPCRVVVTLVDGRVKMDAIGRQTLTTRFPCLGEFPKVSRISENIYARKQSISRIAKEKEEAVRNLMLKIAAEADEAAAGRDER